MRLLGSPVPRQSENHKIPVDLEGEAGREEGEERMMFKMLRFWIKEVKWARKHYLNGLPSYFAHKTGFIKSPSLGYGLNPVLTFKEDWKARR